MTHLHHQSHASAVFHSKHKMEKEIQKNCLNLYFLVLSYQYLLITLSHVYIKTVTSGFELMKLAHVVIFPTINGEILVNDDIPV